MPGLSGIESTRHIKTASPDTAVLVLSMFDDDDSVFAAIQAVARGEAVFGAAIADRVLGLFTNQPTAHVEPFPQLTHRERQILELLAQGQPNAAIAGSVGTTPKTVRNHVSNIFTKLQVLDRTQAVIRVRDAGYGRDT